MTMANYPGGFKDGISIRGVPLTLTHPGKVFWVSNTSTLLYNQKAGSDGNDGSFNAPYATLEKAINQCVADRGDVIFIKPGHAENVASATALNFDVAGIAIIGLGTGTKRPTFTVTTANTATIPVSAANITVMNCVFVANFLSIAACFTVATAANFTVQNCYFKDTSSILNFLNIIKTTGAANTADGLTFEDNMVINLGVTSNNTTILTANDIDRLVVRRNYAKWAVQNDKAIFVIVTAGVLTNLIFTDNMGYRPNTTTAGGSAINVGGTTSTGIVARNYIQTLTTATDLLFTTTVGLAAFENRVTGVVGATGFVIPAVDS